MHIQFNSCNHILINEIMFKLYFTPGEVILQYARGLIHKKKKNPSAQW